MNQLYGRLQCDLKVTALFKQTPAASKEIAERAVERYRKMHEKEGNNFFLEIFDDVIKVQKWHGSRKDHIKIYFMLRVGLVNLCTNALI